MKFNRVIGQKELMQAAIFGSIAGIIGVVFFVFILNSMNSVDVQESAHPNQEGQEETIPVQSNETESETNTPTSDLFVEKFYANQYGVFSTFNGATEFMAGYPFLNTSAIVKVDNSYYIWSEISTVKEGLTKSENPESFIKEFTLSGGACTNPSIQNIPILLSNEDRSKYYFEGGEIPENLPDDWQTITVAMANLSSDLDVTRAHLLKHYTELNSCLKIQF
ncbi:hypothetical protein [Ureibacillus acetophenoni]|uniref:Uncharacterized protein n=1 Tax=Ureibacillus acetophenoni TaxID=614649 RepID=A0A285U3M3_9BACL|nr:hypothetical protein [Ureibacillus acetophenoni]SOC36432.1 hypothetical protein SAMN05877842_102350 [Ureibacillus acetophenoni]